MPPSVRINLPHFDAGKFPDALPPGRRINNLEPGKNLEYGNNPHCRNNLLLCLLTGHHRPEQGIKPIFRR